MQIAGEVIQTFNVEDGTTQCLVEYNGGMLQVLTQQTVEEARLHAGSRHWASWVRAAHFLNSRTLAHKMVILRHPDIFPSGNLKYTFKEIDEAHKRGTVWLEGGVCLVWMEYKKKKMLSQVPIVWAQQGDIRILYFASARPGIRDTTERSHAQLLLAKFLEQKSSQIVWLWVGEDNGRARHFYERNGFKQQGTKEKSSVQLLLLNHCAVPKRICPKTSVLKPVEQGEKEFAAQMVSLRKNKDW